MGAPVAVSWPLSSAPGASLQESGGRLFNCASEPLGKENPLQVVWRRRPGLSSFANLALSGFRGSILVDNLAYIAAGGSIVTVDDTGTVSVAGALAGNDRVTFARDNASPNPDIQCVSPANGAFAVTSGSVTPFNGGGVLPVPNSVAAQDGYFFWTIGDGRVFAAGPNSTTVNALTFITVQSRATGNLLRCVPYQGLMWFCASEFIEVWADTANPFPGFPYSRYAVIDKGLFGRNAIAGWEDGFGQLMFVGNDAGVYQMNGTAPVKVSPPDLDRLIAAIPQSAADTLICFAYVETGKQFFVVQSPNWCWGIQPQHPEMGRAMESAGRPLRAMAGHRKPQRLRAMAGRGFAVAKFAVRRSDVATGSGSAAALPDGKRASSDISKRNSNCASGL